MKANGNGSGLRRLLTIIARIEDKKAQLDPLRPLLPHALKNLEHAHDLELTYTSNAIEGNTFTRSKPIW